jgi:hypothetical protein
MPFHRLWDGLLKQEMELARDLIETMAIAPSLSREIMLLSHNELAQSHVLKPVHNNRPV